MSTSSCSYGKRRDIKCKAIRLLGLLIVINSATAIDYAASRRDAIPRGIHRQTSLTTRNILEQLNRRNGTSSPTLQDATEQLLQYGALLRIEILDTFGRLVYDHYDDFGMRQIEALYRVYSETLERKYNIFDIVPSVLHDPDTRPTKICSHINRHVRTCLKESSQVCARIKIHDEAHGATHGKRGRDSIKVIYRSGQISKNYPNGFSLKAVLRQLHAGRLRMTAALFSGLLHNVQYDNFDDKVRTAERELVAYLGETSTIWIARRLEKRILGARKVSELLKNYLSAGSELFAERVADRASYLSRHVVREVDAVSENIELLAAVYDNSTINLKYLFELVLPNDSVARDVLEARDYLLHELTTMRIVETHLSVEKYQQNGPDQLLLEILGQLRDAGYAEDIVASLYVHALYWHKSHMIGNVNELLELFDAYENLRDVKNYRGLVKIGRVIKNNLRDSKNVTVELLCSRPRECLRIGLRMVADCGIINERTKRAIEIFIERTTHGCPYLMEDAVGESVSGEASDDRASLSVADQAGTTVGDEYSVEAGGSGERDDSRDASSALVAWTESLSVSKSGSSAYPPTGGAPTDPADPSTSRPEATNGPDESDLELSEEIGRSASAEVLPEETTMEESCADDCSSGDCVGTNCNANHNANSDIECASGSCDTIECNGEDCGGCNGARDCAESSCENGDCGSASAAIADCEGDDCDKDVCEGLDCEDERVTPKILTVYGKGTTDETSDGCEGPECATSPTLTTASPMACRGDECSNELSEQTCEGPNCPASIMEESREGSPADDCENGDCEGSERCEGTDCSAEAPGSTSTTCTSEACSRSVENCDGEDCTMNSQESDAELVETFETSTATIGSTSTQSVPLPIAKPMIICNNSDPHYRRKLNRLRKIRLIDALSTKSMASDEIVDETLASDSHGITNGPELTNAETRITEKTILIADLTDETPARHVVPAESNSKVPESMEMRARVESEEKKLIATNAEQATPKRTGLVVTDLDESEKETKNVEETSKRFTDDLDKSELPMTHLEETSWTTKNQDESTLRTATLEETSGTTKSLENPRSRVTDLEVTSWTTKHPKEQTLRKTTLEESGWVTKSPEEPELRVTEMEGSTEVTKYPKTSRLRTEESDWTMETSKKSTLPVLDENEIILTTKNVSKPIPKVTIASKPNSRTTTSDVTISRTNESESAASGAKNPRTMSLEMNGAEDTITEMKSLERASSNERNDRHDSMSEFLRNEGTSSRSVVSTDGPPNSGSYEIGESSKGEVGGGKSTRQRSDPEGDDSLMEKSDSSENFFTARRRGERMKEGRGITSDEDDEEARDSIRRQTEQAGIARTIESAGGPKRWRWSARKNVRIVPDRGHRWVPGEGFVLKPGRPYSRRRISDHDGNGHRSAPGEGFVLKPRGIFSRRRISDHDGNGPRWVPGEGFVLKPGGIFSRQRISDHDGNGHRWVPGEGFVLKPGRPFSRRRISYRDGNGHRSAPGEGFVLKPGGIFSSRVHVLQGSNEDTSTMKRVPKMRQIQENESGIRAIGDGAPKIREIEKWKIREIGEDEPKTRRMREQDFTFHEFGNRESGLPKIWIGPPRTREFKKQKPKIRDERVYWTGGRGSKIYDEALDRQPEMYEMEKRRKISRNRIEGEGGKYLTRFPRGKR